MACFVGSSLRCTVFTPPSVASAVRIHQQRIQPALPLQFPLPLYNSGTRIPFAQSCVAEQRLRLLCLANEGRQDVIDIEANVHDEDWERQRREETEELERRRQVERGEEQEKETKYRDVGRQLKGYPEEDVKNAKLIVSSLIKSGEELEERIEEAAENGELTPLVLLVIRNRLELARHDDERHAIQALDLLYRRVEVCAEIEVSGEWWQPVTVMHRELIVQYFMEMLQKEASLAMHLLHELLNLHDGFSHEEWLRRARKTMLQVFTPEDAFTILGSSGMDLGNVGLIHKGEVWAVTPCHAHACWTKQIGPIEIPDEDDALLRIDFIREVDELLAELETQSEIQPVSGFDAQSVGVRLRQQEKLRAIQLVKDLRYLAATLKW